MKLRNGFISNSSSSSFVATMNKSTFDSLWLEANPLWRAIMLSTGHKEGDIFSLRWTTGEDSTFDDKTLDKIFSDAFRMAEEEEWPVCDWFKIGDNPIIEPDLDIIHRARTDLMDKLFNLESMGWIRIDRCDP